MGRITRLETVSKLRNDWTQRELSYSELRILVEADKHGEGIDSILPLEPAVSSERGNIIRQNYAEFIQSYHWDYFMTSTFDIEKSLTKQPRKEPYYALKTVWHELHGHSNVDRAFLVAEPFQSGDLHIHGLLAGDFNFKPLMKLSWDIWQGLYDKFGRAKVEACNNQEAVSLYCAKYVLKQQSRVCDYYEVFGNKHFWQNGKL